MTGDDAQPNVNCRMDERAEAKSARIAYFTEPFRMEVRREPLRIAEGEIALTSELIGISCGSELLLFRNEFPQGRSEDALPGGPDVLEYPCAYGYMNVAHDDSGERYFAFAPHCDCFAARPESLVPIGEIPAEDAIFAASLETALAIVQDAAPVAGERIVVLGQGMIGLLVSELLAMNGLLTLYATERSSFRRDAAKNINLTLLPSNPAEVEDFVGRETHGRGFDRAIDVSGNESALQFAIDHLAFEGTIVEASWFGRKRVALTLGGAFHRKRLRVKASQVSNVAGELAWRFPKRRRMEVALDLLDRIRPSRYISHRFPLDECQEAFNLIADETNEVLQPVLEP